MGTLSGQVTIDGVEVAGAEVVIVDTAGSSDPAEWSVAGGTTTESNGSWSVGGLDGGTDRYHAMVQFEDGGQLYHAESLPFLTVMEVSPDPAGLSIESIAPDIRHYIPDSQGTHQWNKDEGSGTTVADSIGSLDGTINGATWQTGAGAGDAYLSYDGSTDHVDLGSGSRSALSHYVNSGEGTIFAWVNPDSTPEGAIVGSTATNSEVGINFLFSSGDLGGYLYDGSGSAMANPSASWPHSGWAPAAMVADGSTLTVRSGTDMAELTSGAISGGTSGDLGANVSIGLDTSTETYYFGGGIDLVWTDSVARSQSDLQQFVSDSEGFYP